MPRSQIDSAALFAAVIAGALALMLLHGPFAWLASIGGLILLLILFAYDQEGYRSVFQSLVFSGVCGFCLALAAGAIFALLAANGEVHLANDQWASKWMPITCGFATLFFWAIDRARMNNRQSTVARKPGRGVPAQRSFIPDFVPAAPPVATPVESTVEGNQPLRPEPPPAREAQPAVFETPPAEPVLVQSVPLQTARPSAAPIIPRTGKEAVIYVTLVGEGLNVLRSVQAEHLGRDFYRITESVPEGETWEYQPGQVVRCKKKNLSSGKALVAVEEAPRAR